MTHILAELNEDALSELPKLVGVRALKMTLAQSIWRFER